MKLSAIMLFVFASMAFAAKGYSQSVRVTLNVNNSSLQKVLDEIEKQSEFHFFYNNKQVDISRNVTIKSNQKEISQVLNQLFAGTNIGYKILENSIILSPKQILETTAAQQQTTKKIKGLVTDETGSPVIGANIKEKETGNGTITDINGNFSLSVGTKSTIIISYIGYITKEVPVGNNTSLTVQLAENTKQLDEVVVTALGIKREEKALGYAVQKVDGDKLAAVKTVNVATSLTGKIAGLNVKNSTEFNTSPSLSLRASAPLLVIDGVPYGNVGLNDIAADDIESVDVLKGATASALYGSQAMGGVINIITRKAKKKFEASAGIRYAGRNQQNYKDTPKDHSQYKYRIHLDKPNLNTNLSLGLNLGKFTMNTDVLYKSFDGYQLFDKKPLVKYFPAYNTTITEELSKTPTSISGYEDVQVAHKMDYRFSKRLKVQLKGSYYMLNKYDFQADNIFEKSEDYTYGGSIDYTISDKSSLVASVHTDHYNRYDKYELKSGRRLEYKNNIIQPRIVYSTTALDKQTITGGLEYYRESLFSDKFETGVKENKSQWYATAFLQDDWSINKQFSVIAGLRCDYHEKYGTNLTPKASVMYKIFPFTVRFNYARGYRSPSIKELYMNWDHLGMFWIYGNSKLKPETNNYISLSGEYVNSWININANVYSNWFRNKIEGMWSNDQTELHYINIGKSRLAGVETMCKIQINRHINVHGAYNYLYTSKDADGVRLSSSSPHSGNIRAEYNTRIPRYATIVNLSGNIMGKKKFDVLDELEIDGKKVEAYYQAKVNPYCLWDLTVSQYIMQNLRITAGITNLFDYTSDRVTFNTSTSPGRNYFIACNYTL